MTVITNIARKTMANKFFFCMGLGVVNSGIP